MFNFREKRIFEYIFYSKAAIGALIVFLLFALNALWGVYDKYLEAAGNRDRAAEEYRAIEERAIATRSDLALLKTERGVEKKIREEFGFAKLDEGVVVIVEEDAEKETVVERKRNFLGSLRETIVNIF